MRRWIPLPVVVGTGLSLALVAATGWLSRPKVEGRLGGDPFEALEIAPTTVALTLARLRAPDGRVVLVTGAGGGGLRAVDLTAAFGRPLRDAVEAVEVLGLEALAAAAETAPTLALDHADLGVPVDAGDAHVAAGTNYREHAEEVGREDGPFLFPKRTRPTGWDAAVPARGRLDYEVELCAVTLERHTADAPARLGYLLCNDFTDRWMLVREIELGGPMGPTGFADAKGGDGMLPVGALLVVPRSPEGFHRDLRLALYVNGVLRQRDVGGRMIWSPREVADRALADCEVDYASLAGPVRLGACDAIAPRTLLLTGTPGGVLFHPLTLWSPGAYLGPGDEVVATASHLGVLRNRVVPDGG